jgi:hypothetical protein
LDCVGGISADWCSRIAAATLRTLTDPTRVPVHVRVNSGFLCPRVACLFDPNANFPVPQPPASGELIGNVEVAFDGIPEHAGFQVAMAGTGFVPVLIGYRVPLPAWCSFNCP